MRNYNVASKLAIINLVNSPHIDRQWLLYYPPRFTQFYPDILSSMFRNNVNPQDVWDRLFTWRN
jgi:hypothetical protein